MASVRFADVQSRPTEFLDCTSLTCDFSHAAVGISSQALVGFQGRGCNHVVKSDFYVPYPP
jgi:hypothetical protein